MGKRDILVGVAAVLLAFGVAAPASAHGDDHDIYKVSEGAASGYWISVWAKPGSSEQLLLLRLDLTPLDGNPRPESLLVETVTVEQGRETVEALPAESGHWEAEVLANSEGATPMTVVIVGVSTSAVEFVHMSPVSPWWMKSFVVAGLLLGISVAWWLGLRARYFFRHSTRPPVLARS